MTKSVALLRGVNGGRRPGAILVLLSVSMQAPAVAAEQASVSAAGVHFNVGFNDYPTIARADELARRLLTPLAAEAVRRKLQMSHTALEPRLFDISREKFDVFVPRYQPATGYGLLVFVPPWPEAKIPDGWPAVLDRYGVLFVTASRLGNDENVLGRRVPLALAALANMQQIFRIDPRKTLIGGFSGGSRVALQIAVAYPDKFSGALLNAGSDPIAKAPVHLPSPRLFMTFQTSTRIVYATGDGDTENELKDSSSISSMIHWCVANVSSRNESAAAHDVADPQTLNWALHSLLGSTKEGTDSLEACRETRQREISAAITRVHEALNSGREADARHMLLDIDASYGGLAARETVSLADRCDCGIFDGASDQSSH